MDPARRTGQSGAVLRPTVSMEKRSPIGYPPIYHLFPLLLPLPSCVWEEKNPTIMIYAPFNRLFSRLSAHLRPPNKALSDANSRHLSAHRSHVRPVRSPSEP